jgi:hypothetical protein
MEGRYMKNYVNLMLQVLCCFVYGVCVVTGDEIDVVKFKPCLETGMEWKVSLTQMALEPNVGCAPESQPEFIPHEITNVLYICS